MIYRFDNFELDAKKFELRKDGAVLPVEPQIFDFLYFIIKHVGRVVTRDEIIDEVWQGRVVSDTTISSCVKSARKILGDDGDLQKYIKTTRGRGFQFVGDIKEDQKSQAVGNDKYQGKVSSQISRQTAAYLTIAVLVFVIGLLLYNQYQLSNNTDEAREMQVAAVGDAPFSIAVMPFVDLSANGDQEYFGDGVSEEVLNVLTAVGELDVTSRTTAFSLKGQNLSVPEIAELLGVNYIVEGSVRSSGNRIRITAQLIDTRSDSHLWSENYDRELNDIFAIQDDISKQIADALKVELIGGNTTGDVPTHNIEAYALYLQGHQLFLDRGTSGLADNITNIERAIELLGQAVSLDPDYAEAWADLATSYIVLPSYYNKKYSSKIVVPLATDAADRAISLDPELSQAWAVKSLVYLSLLEFQRSEDSILKATFLNPNNATAWLWQGLHFSAVGNQDRAIEAIEHAIELAPMVAINHSALGMFYHAKGDVGKALPSMEKASNELGFVAGKIDRALLAIWNGNRDRARDEMSSFFKSYEQGSDQELENRLDIYTDAFFDASKRDAAKALLKEDLANGIDTSYGIYMVQDGGTFINDFKNTFVNKGFILSRIYYPIARPLFRQKEFRDYLISIGLLDYWKNNRFPYFCRAIGDDDFECDAPSLN
tara:strand:- start:102404 stop:104371 length:1968 start_codon:yes stop_codon:yes gene_type:complete